MQKKCRICPAPISKDRLRLYPLTKTCSSACTMVNSRRIQTAAVTRYQARQRAAKKGAHESN